jgi:hypothetical protein
MESALVLMIVQNGATGVKRDSAGRKMPSELKLTTTIRADRVCEEYTDSLGDQKQGFNAENAKIAEPPLSSAFSAIRGLLG